MRILFLLLSACLTTTAYAKIPKPKSLATCYYVATMQITKLKPLQFKPVFNRVSRQSHDAMQKATMRNSFKRGTHHFYLTVSAPCQSFRGVFEARNTLERMLYNNWALLRRTKPSLCCWPKVKVRK